VVPVELRALDRERLRMAFSFKATPYRLPDEDRGQGLTLEHFSAQL
jgi:hypothetical protein